MKKALLVVDMSNDFLPSNYNLSMELGRGRALIPRIRGLEEAFLGSKEPVIYVTDRHLRTDFELEKWGPHSMKGKEGSKIIDGLLAEHVHVLERIWKRSDIRSIKKGELLFEVEKGTYSGFVDSGGKPTALGDLLTRIGFKPGDRICIAGVHTNCCVKHTAADAWFRGYIPVIVEDCVDAFDDSTGAKGMGHSEALNYMRYWYDAEVKTSEEIKAELVSGTTQDRRGL
jgi:nicotinamidase-related amidase